MPEGAKFERYDMSIDPGETNNIADERPDIVDKMKSGYEQWFREVSSTRGFDPVRIRLGSSHEPFATLSRFDWRGDYDGRAREDSLGYGPVAIARAGRYDFTFRFAGPLPRSGRATLRVGSAEVAQAVPADTESCEFEVADLEIGPSGLEALIRYGGVRGASFVDVSLRE